MKKYFLSCQDALASKLLLQVRKAHKIILAVWGHLKIL
jgi:hypothetical protein